MAGMSNADAREDSGETNEGSKTHSKSLNLVDWTIDFDRGKIADWEETEGVTETSTPLYTFQSSRLDEGT
jgi:hypothetical protein